MFLPTHERLVLDYWPQSRLRSAIGLWHYDLVVDPHFLLVALELVVADVLLLLLVLPQDRSRLPWLLDGSHLLLRHVGAHILLYGLHLLDLLLVVIEGGIVEAALLANSLGVLGVTVICSGVLHRGALTDRDRRASGSTPHG